MRRTWVTVVVNLKSDCLAIIHLRTDERCHEFQSAIVLLAAYSPHPCQNGFDGVEFLRQVLVAFPDAPLVGGLD